MCELVREAESESVLQCVWERRRREKERERESCCLKLRGSRKLGHPTCTKPSSVWTWETLQTVALCSYTYTHTHSFCLSLTCTHARTHTHTQKVMLYHRGAHTRMLSPTLKYFEHKRSFQIVTHVWKKKQQSLGISENRVKLNSNED